MNGLVARARRLASRLRSDRAGLATMELALVLPIIIPLGCFGLETSNLAITNMRISQAALNLADTASRVGLSDPLAKTQLREVDINDLFAGVRTAGADIKLTTYGRITLSSLENVKQDYDTAAVQRIHWQRCIGLKSGTNYDSSYGVTSTSAGSDATSANAGLTTTTGMGDTGAKVTAPTDSGVMFVEINYDYQPLFGSMFGYVLGAQRVHYVASFIVRDKRDFSRIFNPSPTATKATCNLYAA